MNAYTEYLSTLARPFPAPVLAVVEKPSMQENIIYNDLLTTPTLLASVRLADKIRYVDGKRVVSEQWSGKAYPVLGMQHGFVLLETGHGSIGRKPENVLIPGYTQAETIAHLARLTTGERKAA